MSNLQVNLPCRAKLSVFCPGNTPITPKENAGFCAHTEAVLGKYFKHSNADSEIIYDASGRPERIMLELDYEAPIDIEYEKDDVWKSLQETDFDNIEDEHGTLSDDILDEILKFGPFVEKAKEDEYEYGYENTEFEALSSVYDCFHEGICNLEADLELD